jgi:hypothetical protein
MKQKEIVLSHQSSFRELPKTELLSKIIRRNSSLNSSNDATLKT